MRLSHLNAYRPLCVHCASNGQQNPLVLSHCFREHKEHIEEGLLGCQACGRSYPILDGIPLLVADLNGLLSGNPLPFLEREDLSREMRGLMGEWMGAGGALDQGRQRLSHY